MKQKLLNVIFAGIMLFAFCLSSVAAINDENDIRQKIEQIQVLANNDYLDFINKSELIGNRLQVFQLKTEQYKSNIQGANERLDRIIEQIKVVNTSNVTNKNSEIDKLYQDAESVLRDIDSKTLQYLIDLRSATPSITYSRFIKKFIPFYNDLNITSNKLKV